MIYTAIDGIFSFLMWMLITPAGKMFFFTCDVAIIIGCFLFLWSTRNDP